MLRAGFAVAAEERLQAELEVAHCPLPRIETLAFRRSEGSVRSRYATMPPRSSPAAPSMLISPGPAAPLGFLQHHEQDREPAEGKGRFPIDPSSRLWPFAE